jgi:hypothetical protein
MDAESIRRQADVCQAIVVKYGRGAQPFEDIVQDLRNAGVSGDELDSYVDQAVQEINRIQARDRSHTLSARSNNNFMPEATPELLSTQEIEQFRRTRDEARYPQGDLDVERPREDQDAQHPQGEREARSAAYATERAGWNLLRAKARATHRSDGEDLDDLGSIFGVREPRVDGIPQSVLSAVPQLAALSTSVGDDHLQETFRLRRIFTSEKVLDPTIDLMQQQQLDVPIPRGLWKDIIQDRFVNFEKLFASMDVGYDHSETPKDFHAGFVLVKKDQLVAKKALKSDGDWMRVFSAWEAAVRIIYIHRADELQRYKKQVMDVFQSDPDNPQAGIRFDAEVRERYAKNPFHMDDRNRTNTYMFSHMLRTTSKRTPTSRSPQTNSKRTPIVCDNWNLGKCSDPCKWQRKHGQCSECGGNHQAKDNNECKTLVQSRASARAATRKGSSS